MKKMLGLLIVLVLIYPAFAASVEEILRSKDVLSYVTGRELYLMDLNTTGEIRIDDNCADFAWDKTGQMLYTIPFITEIESNTITLDINTISLPSLAKNRLDTLPVPRFRGDDEFMDYWLYLDKDANLTIETKYGASHESRWLTTYSLATHRWLPAVEGTFLPSRDCWLPAGNKRITTEGYGIINRPTVGFNELYINRAKPGEPENYAKITNFHALMNQDPSYVNYAELIQFTTSPDGSIILFGSVDKYDGFGLRPGVICAVNSDGTHEQILNDDLFLDQTTNYGWLSDGRLFFSGLIPDSYYDMTLCLLDKQGKITTLKSFTEGADFTRALYRYKSK